MAQSRSLAFDNSKFQLSLFPALSVAYALRHLKEADNKDTVVIEFHTKNEIYVSYSSSSKQIVLLQGYTTIYISYHINQHSQSHVKTKPTYFLDPNATYLIVGGLGGLGRSMARWLISRGPRNLAPLSRSGPKNSGAPQLLTELEGQGVRVVTPRCDVSNGSALTSVLGSCEKVMPPIKGCFQSSMFIIVRL